MAASVSARCRRHRVPKGYRVVVAVLVVLLGAVSSAVVTTSIAGAATDTVTNCSGSASVHGSLPYVVAHAALRRHRQLLARPRRARPSPSPARSHRSAISPSRDPERARWQ